MNKNINENILNLELLINIGGNCNSEAINSKYINGFKNFIILYFLLLFDFFFFCIIDKKKKNINKNLSIVSVVILITNTILRFFIYNPSSY